MTKFWWRHDDMLSCKEFVFQSIVVVLLELLEGQQRSGTHDSMILWQSGLGTREQELFGLFKDSERQFTRNGGETF